MSAFDAICYSSEFLKLCWVFALIYTIIIAIFAEEDSRLKLIPHIFGAAGIITSLFQILLVIWLAFTTHVIFWSCLLLPLILAMLALGLIWNNHPRWTGSILGMPAIVISLMVGVIYPCWTILSNAWQYWHQIG